MAGSQLPEGETVKDSEQVGLPQGRRGRWRCSTLSQRAGPMQGREGVWEVRQCGRVMVANEKQLVKGEMMV